MKDGDRLPYSAEGLEALASTLKIHRSLLWFDATSNRITFKQPSSREHSYVSEEEEE